MELRNCPECGKLFAYVSRNLCPECIEKEEEMFRSVERFLKEHGSATVQEISEATGVPESKVISFLRAGRLVASSGMPLLECERCGKPITTGRFCDACRSALEAALKEGSGQAQSGAIVAKPNLAEDSGRRRMITAELYRKSRRKT